MTWNYPCDNELNIPYDGCNNDCQIEPNFQCNVITIYTTCSYGATVSMNLISFEFDTVTQDYLMILEIEQPLYAFSVSSPI